MSIMQAAVVSILLMVGACGASDQPDDLQPAPAVTVYAPPCDGVPTNNERPEIVCPGELCERMDLVFFKVYTPVLLMHGNAEFYPGNYARPYDYREKFDYPWNGPRPCYGPRPMAEPEMAARVSPGQVLARTARTGVAQAKPVPISPPSTASVPPSPSQLLVR
jgi:hypothetical protein